MVRVVNAIPRHFTPGKTSGTFTAGLLDSSGQCGRVKKNSPLQGFNIRTIQPLASRYTDYTIQFHNWLDGKERLLEA